MFTQTGDRAGRFFHRGIELIQEVVTVSSQGSVTFSGIPTTYRDLELAVRGRGTNASTNVNVNLQFNGDGGSNYDDQLVEGFASTASAAGLFAQTSLFIAQIPAGTATANFAGNALCRIFDYRGTVFNKNTMTVTGFIQSTSGSNEVAAVFFGQWRSTSVINSVKVLLSAGNFVDGSVVSLYGSY